MTVDNCGKAQFLVLDFQTCPQDVENFALTVGENCSNISATKQKAHRLGTDEL